MGFQPYLPREDLCVLVERVELQPGALPMACVAVLCWVLQLRVGEVSGLRVGDVSCLYGYVSGIPKLVRRGDSLGRSRHGRMVSGRPCFGGRWADVDSEGESRSQPTGAIPTPPPPSLDPELSLESTVTKPCPP